MAYRAALILPLILLGACSDREQTALAPEARDPAVLNVLYDPLMVDPDLASQNRPYAALDGGGPASAMIPLVKRSDEAIAAAKAEAAKLLGKDIQSAPSPTSGDDDATSPESIGLAAASLSAEGKRCAAKLGYSARWALALPPALPIYPRGHVQEAGGNDLDRCKLRAVNFLTPVPLPDVVAFYHAKLSPASPSYRLQGGDHVLRAGAMLVYIRLTFDGLTEVDLIAG